MNAISKNLSRRTFMQLGAATGASFVLGVTLGPSLAGKAAAQSGPDHGFNLFVTISDDGAVELIAMSPDIGQGARTSMPAIIADEMEADWSRVSLRQAGADPRLGDQGVGGSSAIRDNYDGLRMAGATVRTMLEQAAADAWGVAASECRAELHTVVHAASGRALGYGELAAAAAEIAVPEPANVRLKDKSEFRYIGKSLDLVDLAAITHGQAIYSIDVRVPGMVYAVMARSPVVGGAVKSVDDTAARAVKGVIDVVPIAAVSAPVTDKSIGGIAVVADSTWAAKKARDLLLIEWDDGPHADYDSKAFRVTMEAGVSAPAKVYRNRGDVDAALAGASKVVEADYYYPHQAHAPMEPPVAVTDYKDGKAEVWLGTQDPVGAQRAVAEQLGIEASDVTLHVTLTGGAFGRKSSPDYGRESALLSKAVGRPVMMVWTREDDIQHDYFHSCCAQKLTAGLDGEGNTTAWLHCTSFPAIASTYQPNLTEPWPFEVGQGVANLPYDIPNIRAEQAFVEAHVRIGWVRSVLNINHAFGVGSFVDELAHEAGADTADYLLKLIGPPRHVDIYADGGTNGYEKQNANFPIDTGRLAAVVRAVRAESGWDKPLPKGRYRGIAAHRSFLTYVAAVVEVEVSDDGDIKIPNVYYAVDCGQAVNPDRIKAQFEGGAVYALGMALHGEITAEAGRVVQSNFHDYGVLRMDQAPEVQVHIMGSDARPSGVGEPPVPPVAPALCNAIFAATGKRIRALPVADQLSA